MEETDNEQISHQLISRIATVLSVVLHPLLMPFYCMAMLFTLPTYIAYAFPFRFQLLIYSIVLITTFMMPVFSAILLFKRGAITDLYLNNRSERVLPFFIAALYYFLCYYLFRQLPVPAVLVAVILGACISVSLALVINFFWKISIHMIGIGGLFGMLISISTLFGTVIILPVVIVTLIAGLLGTARLISGRHSALQIYTGFLTGAAVEYIMLTFFAK